MPSIFRTSSTRLKNVIVELDLAKQQLQVADTIFNTIGPCIITDDRQVIIRANDAFTRLSGYEAHELIGRTPRLLQSGQHDKAFYAAILDSIGRTGSWQGEIYDRHKGGSIFPRWLTISAVTNANGQLTNFVATYTDLSEQKQSRETIERLTFHDLLTNLPNQTALVERITNSTTSEANKSQYSALLYIDLDHFKHINDQYGYPTGDQLLKHASLQISQCVADGDTAARLSGDKFAVFLTGLGCQEEHAAGKAEQTARQLALELGKRCETSQEVFHVTASIGISIFRNDSSVASELLHQAELACFNCKADGGNGFRFFDPEMAVSAKRRVSLERELGQAISSGELEVYYQPQFTADGVVRGAEALVRWKHPRDGIVSPAIFIPLAEETGQILAIGRFVLETSCRELAALSEYLNNESASQITIAVNVSARQFLEDSFVAAVKQILAETGANPAQLKLELTESLFLSNTDVVIEKMHELRAMGIGLSLDDFGTGYSSLAYLRRMPLDQLKIDQSFVRDVTSEFGAAAITQSLVAMAHSLGLTVVAEGVETQEQRSFLIEAGCFLHQGYLYSKPLPREEFYEFLKVNNALYESAPTP